MLAKQHANLGVAGYIGVVAALAGTGAAATAVGHHGFFASMGTPAALASTAVVAGGFALLPDLDEPGSTVSRKFGPLSRGVSHVMKVVCFGHRGASHSLLFALLMAYLGTLAATNPLAVGVIFVVSASLIIRLVLPLGLGKRHYTGVLALAIVAAYLVVRNHAIPPHGLAFAMGIGVVLHCVGDTLTPQGTRFLWPLPMTFRLPINGRTGAGRELYVTQPLLILAAVAAVVFLIVQPAMHAHTINVGQFLKHAVTAAGVAR